MIVLKTVDLRNDFKKVSDLIMSGEIVLISRPHNENLVILSEREYNELENPKKNPAYNILNNDSPSYVAEGVSISFTLDEINAMENMSIEEIQSLLTAKRAVYNNIRKPKRNIGFIKGLPEFPDSFFDPLPEDELQLWGL